MAVDTDHCTSQRPVWIEVNGCSLIVGLLHCLLRQSAPQPHIYNTPCCTSRKRPRVACRQLLYVCQYKAEGTTPGDWLCLVPGDVPPRLTRARQVCEEVDCDGVDDSLQGALGQLHQHHAPHIRPGREEVVVPVLVEHPAVKWGGDLASGLKPRQVVVTLSLLRACWANA
mgnify:CR=1 FL=1